MRVNVVAKLGWILERLAQELEPLGASVNCGQVERLADPRADLNYYMPARDILKFPCPGRAVGLYTHGDTALEIADRFEACVSMNRTMAGRLRGTAARRVVTIRPGTEPPPRRIVFGVVGRVYGKDRKGPGLVASALEAGFDFRACTDFEGDAPCPVTHPVAQRSKFYASIDYLVVTSTEEGGPMPVLEAIAHGVPVIAPDVGWCWEFPVLRYRVGRWSSLCSVLDMLTAPPTWAAWTAAHARLFNEVLKEAPYDAPPKE